MRHIILLLCCLSGGLASAQQYQCLQPNTRQFFVNRNHYLRGMRIDSVVTSGGSTVFYPFHTPRSITPGGYQLDSNGGSWLGKKVIQLADGTTWFDNIWHDTVTMLSQAALGNSWVFYNDTSAYYYTATVTAVDTLSVLGQLDSVKTIQITAMKGMAVQTTNPINNYSIVLSRQHGFVRIFDLYTFPYAVPGAPYNPNLDFFLRQNNYVQPKYASFTQVDYKNPESADIYGFAIGDVFQYDGTLSNVSLSVEYVRTTSRDSVVAKTLSANDVSYRMYHWETTTTSYYNSGPLTVVTGPAVLRTFAVANHTIPIVDTLKMPEEKGSAFLYYFDPLDSAHCFTSPLYKRQQFYFVQPLDVPIPEMETYKAGFGQTDSINGFIGPNPYINTSYIRRMYNTNTIKNGSPCGKYIPFGSLSVVDAPGDAEGISIFPNPAGKTIFLNFSGVVKGNTGREISLIDMNGYIIYHVASPNKNLTIDASRLPGGVYQLQIIEGERKTNRMVSVIH